MIDRLVEYIKRLDAYQKAELAILDGAQSYQIRIAIDDLINRIEIEDARN